MMDNKCFRNHRRMSRQSLIVPLNSQTHGKLHSVRCARNRTRSDEFTDIVKLTRNLRNLLEI